MIVDLFSGAGGWSEGLRALGLRDVGIEWDEAACRTRSAAGHRTIRANVAQYPTEPFVGRVRGLIASPPCQAFSLAGKGKGRGEVDRVHAAVELCRSGWTDAALLGPWADPRTALILQPLRWAWALRPAWIACEQVPPALGVWEHMADVLRAWGYAADARVLCTADYGVPQTRNRAYLIASTGALRWPDPTHAQSPEPSLFGEGRLPWVSMAEALGWEEGSRSWDRRVGGFALDARTVPDSEPAPTVMLSHGRDVWRLNPGQTETQPNRRTYAAEEPAPAIAFGKDVASRRWELHQNNRPNGAVRGPDEPAPTLHFGGRVNDVRWVVRWVVDCPATTEQGSVRITVQEAAILQGFRSDYPWQGSRTAQYQQIGNAVAPPMAAALVGALEGKSDEVTP